MPNFLLRLTPNWLAVLAFSLAAIIMVGVAFGAALVIERRSENVVSASLSAQNIAWITVATDGLQVRLTGTAPNEADRFRAVNLVGSLIDSSRIRDKLEVTPASEIEAPRFSVEMLRNDDGVQLIGLLPEKPVDGGIDLDQLTQAAATLVPDTEVANMLESAAYPAPPTWNDALTLGIEALKRLKRSKISVSAEEVKVIAISDSEAEKRQLESSIRTLKPDGVTLVLEISAPRPVITPFTLRFLLDENGAGFDSCSADTDGARKAILTAGAAAGVTGAVRCTVGLGVPTPRWAEAVITGIKAVKVLGSGSITFSDSDVTLLGGPDVTQAAFDRVVGELENALPDAFSLQATLPKKESVTQGPAEFTASLSAEGKVELRGRLTDEMLRAAVDAYSRAAFGNDQVYTATRLDPDLPDGWPVRVLAGLEALAELHEGTVLVRDDLVDIKGVSGSQDSRGRITQILSAKLGQGKTFTVAVRYDEALDPLAALPTPDECAAKVNAVTARTKITFTPASAEIALDARPVIDALAQILIHCPTLSVEIGGYTDSQGSETGNQALSKARAEAVLLALQGRRIDVSGFTAVGYGEADPIADNGTEAGREANRRIEFALQGELAAAAAVASLIEPLAAADATGPDDEPAAVDVPAADIVGGTDNLGSGDGVTGTDAIADPDFSGDTSPSVAPTEMTMRPKPRPEGG